MYINIQRFLLRSLYTSKYLFYEKNLTLVKLTFRADILSSFKQSQNRVRDRHKFKVAIRFTVVSKKAFIAKLCLKL